MRKLEVGQLDLENTKIYFNKTINLRGNQRTSHSKRCNGCPKEHEKCTDKVQNDHHQLLAMKITVYGNWKWGQIWVHELPNFQFHATD